MKADEDCTDEMLNTSVTEALVEHKQLKTEGQILPVLKSKFI